LQTKQRCSMSILDTIHMALVDLDFAGEYTIKGESDETISSESGEALMDNGPWALQELAKGLNEIQKDHVYTAIIADYERARDAMNRLQKYYDKLKQTRPDLFK